MKVLEIVEALARMKKQERLQFAEAMIDRFPNLAEELCVLLESNPEPVSYTHLTLPTKA